MTILYKEFKSTDQCIATKQTSLCGKGCGFDLPTVVIC